MDQADSTRAPIEPGDPEYAIPLSLKQAAARYGVGERQLREAIHRNELPYIPWGEHMRLLPETLNAFFRNRQRLYKAE